MSEINMSEKVPVKNLCAWDLFFPRINTNGSVKIPANGIIRLERDEIQSQVYNGNIMFVGIDGKGSHARVFVDDKATRVLVGFESEDEKEKQDVVDDEKIDKILALKTMSAFKKNIEENILLQSEKYALIERAKKVKLNDHEKIKFIEEYTGYKFEESDK